MKSTAARAGNSLSRLLIHIPLSLRDRLELLNRLFFNIFLGNNDAHSKNFALLHDLERTAAIFSADL